jgi:undecaprenyl-phosphate 4-deoxy-4-formamido-L-arabinose transferase
MPMNPKKLSIVIPVYNGAATIGPLVDKLESEFLGQMPLEVVLVNDGSPRDNSAEVCTAIARQKPWVVFVDLSRNFGEHNAVMAGLNHCSGDRAVIMDDDFQNLPEEVHKLLDELDKGHDVVFSKYASKKHHPLRNLGSRFNNRVASVMLDKPRDLYMSSFKVINRFVIDEVIKYDGPYPYIDGLILRVTRRYGTVEVQHNDRAQGESNYTLRKLVSLWLNMFVNFSILPLRVVALAGFLFAALGLLGVAYAVYIKFTEPDLPLGWTSIVAAFLLVSSVQLISIGVLGEYLGRLFMKTNLLPQFVVKSTLNVQRPGNNDHE